MYYRYIVYVYVCIYVYIPSEEPSSGLLHWPRAASI